MADVTLYTTPFCPFCHRAKQLLAAKDVSFEEIDVWTSPERRREMMERADGRHTVPQIFIGGEGIGGCDDLYALERSGQLDRLLGGGPA